MLKSFPYDNVENVMTWPPNILFVPFELPYMIWHFFVQKESSSLVKYSPAVLMNTIGQQKFLLHGSDEACNVHHQYRPKQAALQVMVLPLSRCTIYNTVQ
jgi:hypothetical protein